MQDRIFSVRLQRPGQDKIKALDLPEMYRNLLPDTGDIYFTHGDLTLCNIIAAGAPGSHKIASMIDYWEQAGWYPEYFEYCKMLYGVEETPRVARGGLARQDC